MFELGFCNELLAGEGLNFHRQCQIIAEIGYDTIEIAPGSLAKPALELSQADIAEMRVSIDAAGLQVTGLHWLLTAWPELSITDPSRSTEAIDVLLGLVELCAALGGDVLVHGSPQQRVIETSEFNSAFMNAREVFKPVAERAAELGLIYCIEPLDPSQTSFINTVEQGAELAHAINNPAFLTMIDSSSSHRSENLSVAELIRQWVPSGLIGHIHLNDSNRGAPGMGSDPFSAIVAALIDCDWDRAVTIEPFRVQGNAQSTALLGYETIQGFANGHRAR